VADNRSHVAAAPESALSRPPRERPPFTAADALIHAASQGGFWEEQKKATAEEAKALTAFEAKIEQIVNLVTSGFKDNEVVALKKINPHRAGIVAIQIGLIGKHLKLIEREIQKVVAQGEIIA
jgi:hypothetical protein